MIQQPCAKDCPDRSAECRLTCPKWAEYTAERAKDYEQRLAKWQAAGAGYARETKIKHHCFVKRRR
nr:MAG TPA: hypothetical protein [Caudoviricetes sp.]